IGHTAKSGIYWGLRDEKEKSPDVRKKGAEPKNLRKGAMTIQLDDRPAAKVFIVRSAQDDPVYMDRFGFFNLQLYHQCLDLYISDLTVNGHKVDLSKDPGWEAKGNRVEFLEQDFQREDFGYSETNWS